MELRIWKRIYLTPFIRLNIYTKSFTVSFGHRKLGWLTLARTGVRETLDTPLRGVYLSEGQRWDQLARALRRLWSRLLKRP